MTMSSSVQHDSAAIHGTGWSHVRAESLVDDASLAARSDAAVLVVASTATHRHQLARGIHERSARRFGPWVTVSFAERSQPRPTGRLFEGTSGEFAQWFDRAQGGTLFIDGIDVMSAAEQCRLLGLLNASVGNAASTGSGQARVRLITGAARELFAAVRERRFPESLFYRLNVIRICEDAQSMEESAMIARDLMSAPPQTCQPDTDLAAVTHLMWSRDCGFVPVVGADGHVVGVITDRDICVAASTRRLLPERIAASEVMSSSVHACLPGDTLDDVLATMKRFQIRRMPVIDAGGRIQGVLSMNDIARAVGRKGAPSASTVVSTMAGICAPRAVASAVA